MRKTRRRLLVLACAPLTWWGCGYIAEPLPPLMNIPARAENMAAVQRGATIIIHFSMPALTTEGMVLKQGVRVDLRIGLRPQGAFNGDAWASGAKPIGGGTVNNSLAEYKTPSVEWTGKQVLIAAKIIGGNKRDAGWQVPAELTVVAPPEQPRELKAEAVPQGVKLTWQGAGAGFVVVRRDPEAKDFQVLGRATKPEYIDTTAQFGKPYAYLVQSFAPAGTGEAQSDPSKEADITPLDTFPPAAPTGLTGVPSTASIELVWERSPDPGTVAYRVYRAAPGSAFELLADGQRLPAYSDRKIESGKTYRYAVTAVKGNQKESKMSEPVEVAAP